MFVRRPEFSSCGPGIELFAGQPRGVSLAARFPSLAERFGTVGRSPPWNVRRCWRSPADRKHEVWLVVICSRTLAAQTNPARLSMALALFGCALAGVTSGGCRSLGDLRPSTSLGLAGRATGTRGHETTSTATAVANPEPVQVELYPVVRVHLAQDGWSSERTLDIRWTESLAREARSGDPRGGLQSETSSIPFLWSFLPARPEWPGDWLRATSTATEVRRADQAAVCKWLIESPPAGVNAAILIARCPLAAEPRPESSGRVQLDEVHAEATAANSSTPAADGSDVIVESEPGSASGTGDSITSSLAAALEQMVRTGRWLPVETESRAPALGPLALLPGPVAATPEVTLSANQRSAAAEAWCLMLARGAAGSRIGTRPAGNLPPASADDELQTHSASMRERLAPVGQLLLSESLPDEVRSTIWKVLARWIPPDQIPGLAESLETITPTASQATSTAGALRLAALEACLIWQSQWNFDAALDEDAVNRGCPASIHLAKRDPQPAARRLYARWLALAKHPDTVRAVRSQLLDADLTVREDAIISLGLLGTEDAQAELERLSQHEGELIRALAVRGLALRSPTAIMSFQKDPAFVVRKQLAKSLATEPSLDAALTLRNLLDDRSPDVQQAVIVAISDWPDDLAWPLLCEALRTSVYLVRQTALAGVTARLGFEPQFPLEGGLDERIAALELWSHDLGRSAELPFESRESLTVSPVGWKDRWQVQVVRLETAPPSSPEYRDVIDQLQRLAIERPVDFEQQLPTLAPSWQAVLRKEVLQKAHPGYQAVNRLGSSDVAIRRRAAQELQEAASRRALSPGILAAIHEVVANEQDRIVWANLLGAIEQDATPEAAAIARLACTGQWPDLRAQGCRWFAAHPSHEAAMWLLPLIQDPNASTRLAAVEALGRCGNPVALDGALSSAKTTSGTVDRKPDPAKPGSGLSIRGPGLRSLLTTTDLELRLAVVLAMAQLRDPAAGEELLRLSRDERPIVRQQVARAFGAAGQARFVPQLVEWAWIESHPAVRRGIVEALEQLVPADQRPQELLPGVAPTRSIDDTIRIWAEWERGQRERGA